MSYHIFVVEDDGMIAASIQAFLTRYGYTVTCAADLARIEREFCGSNPTSSCWMPT